MTYPSGTAPGARTDTDGPTSLDNLDRILLGAGGAVWLTALGTGVAATVALADLAGATAPASGAGDTPWLLYGVIGISAGVIAAAVPPLLRARRNAQDEPAPLTVQRGLTTPGERSAADTAEPPTEKLSVAAVTPVPSRLDAGADNARVEQLWLRCALVIAIAMGAAMIAIGVATYLMAVGTDPAAWVLYGLAAVITLAMPVAPWWYLRELRALPESR
ncbi:MAG: DUF2561 family protein [Actinomycetota bacterium]|nr:DUF2561 family protein [Actinomycetota bacterium]